ncbi:MAG: ABC transporter ATP-binding protein [Coriobacteriales bacterium]|nr:ABC transporter ATP-binding protein [Coriobacteriales bacterium]
MESPEWLHFAVFVVFAFVQVQLMLTIPDYMKEITNVMQSNVGDIGAIAPSAAMMALCTLGSVVSAVIASYCVAYVSSVIIMRMRNDLFGKLMSFNLPEMTRFSASSLITRCTNDVEMIRSFIAIGPQAIIQCPLMVSLAVSKMSGNPEWTGAILIAVAVLTVATVTLLLLSLSKTARAQKLVDAVNRLTKEHVTGIRVVHAYNGYGYQKRQFDATNDDLMKTTISSNRYTGAIMPFFTLCVNGLTLAIYVIGSFMILNAGEVAQKQELFSQMVVFVTYALNAFNAFAAIILLFAALPRVVVSLRRINEVLNCEPSIHEGMAMTGANGKLGSLEFRNVSFAYPGAAEPMLKNVSFSVERGQTLAIVGATGSGKTTLLNLIMRFYDVSEGAVFVDGRDVRDYNLWALRDKMGYVPQKSFLFAGTIGSNIDYGDQGELSRTLADIKHAAEVGQSKEFIEQKNGGYEARVEEGGSNFSGGQRQRLTISRAVCRDPEFYLFDDSFSALDFKTDSVLRKKLRENAREATQIIVGQRIGSIMNADNILVIDKGVIVGQGTHKELLESCQVYQEIALSQLNSEELS